MKAIPAFAGTSFGGQRKGQRGWGAAGKIPVFGILKRQGKVYTKVIPDASSETLIPIITRKIRPDSIVSTDGYKGYDTLDVAGFQHHRINHFETFVADTHNHINGIENPHLRGGRLLEPGQALDAHIERHPQKQLFPLPQRVRVPLQPPLSKSPVGDPLTMV